MIVSAHFSKLLPKVNNNDLIEFYKTILEKYVRIYNEHNSCFIGWYGLLNNNQYDICRIFFWKTDIVTEIKDMLNGSTPFPEDIINIEKEFSSYLDNNAQKLNIWFEPIVFSKNSNSNLDIKGKLMRILNFELSTDKSLDQLTEFEHRIEDKYTDHMNIIDWNYMGVFESFGFPAKTFGELEFVNAKSPEDALEKDRQLGETPEITKIVEECRTFFGKINRENVFWLEPLLLTDFVKNGIVLNS